MRASGRRDVLAGAAGLAPGLARRPECVARKGREDEEGRTWDERNRPLSVRVRERDRRRLTAAAKAQGMSKDQLARSLLWAALDALEGGWLELETNDVETKVTDKMDRVRIYVRREGRPRWKGLTLPQGND